MRMHSIAGTLICSGAALVTGATASAQSVEDFYRGIDVSLNPVVVRGGLNFKSVRRGGRSFNHWSTARYRLAMQGVERSLERSSTFRIRKPQHLTSCS